jgi:hypothetical protein
MRRYARFGRWIRSLLSNALAIVVAEIIAFAIIIPVMA